ncbi:thiol peroxidase [Lacinutrix venerupis]|uniref:Thiol peroxidase n=1 Tax=Lacinutrix venerupis TaxID=1486034 RepID=A0AAC9LMT5_9FLAO|nr:thiol peroxidase [Lacinutrix venerupis]APY00483.1 lipid hydroperoxide peroxidase [Lacinutrix venerupis]
MATITLGGKPIETLGSLPNIGEKAPDFTLTLSDLSTKNLSDFKGHKVLLNIFPSVDTGVCAQSARAFNKEAAEMNNTKVLCISRDLPFAQARFCAAEGLDNVLMLSDFKDGSFGKNYGLEVSSGSFAGLHSRCVIVLDENAVVKYTEQVPEIGEEPNYKASLYALLDE